MLSLAGSVPAPCERRTYTRKQNPNIFMQCGWELSQQWSSGEFRGMQPKRVKGQHWACEHWMRSAVQSLNWVQWNCQRWFVILLSSVQWSVLRPTYVRCPTKHTNFMYRQGCIWMKVCPRWCKLDRGPLQAHCAWKRPLASWNMQLPWLDSVPAGSQSLHKHSPTMFSWELTICGACPTEKAGRAGLSRLEGQGLQLSTI